MNFLRNVFYYYVTTRRVAAALVEISAGLMVCVAALVLLAVGAVLSIMLEFPAAIILVVIIAIWIAAHGFVRVCEALPGILPAKLSDAPGKSRLATRRDLRRAGII